MYGLSSILAFAATWTFTAAHLVPVYPGLRGNSLHTNGTEPDGSIIPGSLGQNWDESTHSYTWPYGMQWMYPCGGLPTSTNRTKWPVNGGALSFQPGWFSGHQTAFIYVNLGIGTEPLNMSHPMNPVFQLTGPSNNNYSGTFCLPQVPLPAGYQPNVGDNATIQIVETAVHGAALYACVDITFANDDDVAPVTPQNCFNGTDAEHANDGSLAANLVFTTKSLQSGAVRAIQSNSGNAIAITIGLGFLLAGLL
ncbi:hypothetical protein NA57DRAFT_51044 [Rhizodiscina lignyota]|uniref:Copper acquisition factor BIM1-like domain-containing protein n=1 Tax=Rhizodiscina lignyota TaxID=1504668 RepID=A0A9P4MB05_9PEZI|nr:hypothetical protein NA57DRAFT_51044 [Rhizodiscina lignyota]